MTKKGMRMKVEDYTIENNQIFFIESNLFVIGQYDIKLRKLKILFDFSQQIDIAKAFSGIIKYQHKIYCIPCYAENIFCLDLRSNQFYSLNIPNELFKEMPKRKIIMTTEIDGKIYCVCRSPHLVISIDAVSDQYEINFCKEISGEHDRFNLKIKDGCLIYPFFHNLIIGYNVRQKDFYISKLYDNNMRNNWDYIFHIFHDEEGHVWISNFRGEVLRIKDGEAEEINIPKANMVKFQIENGSYNNMISEMLYIDENVYFIMADDDRILRYEIEKKSFSQVAYLANDKLVSQERHYDNCKIYNNILFVYRPDEEMFYTWDFKEETLGRFEIIAEADILANLQSRFFYIESSTANLEFYFSLVKIMKNNYLTCGNKFNGREIYNQIDRERIWIKF